VVEFCNLKTKILKKQLCTSLCNKSPLFLITIMNKTMVNCDFNVCRGHRPLEIQGSQVTSESKKKPFTISNFYWQLDWIFCKTAKSSYYAYMFFILNWYKSARSNCPVTSYIQRATCSHCLRHSNAVAEFSINKWILLTNAKANVFQQISAKLISDVYHILPANVYHLNEAFF
jgi:hypothetical protein